MDGHQREIAKLVKGLGLKLGSHRQGGGHIKYEIYRGDVVHKVVFPVSPSDGRWKKNMESFLKRKFNL